MMDSNPLTRRLFLQWSAGQALWLPFLSQGQGLMAAPSANNSQRPMRLLIFHTPMGTFPRLWTPRNVPAHDGSTPMITNDLSLNVMHGPLQDWRHRVVWLEGLSFPNVNGNHAGGIRQGLTCGGADSFDVAVARAMQQQGVDSFLPALHLGAGVEYDSVLRENDQTINNIFHDPAVVFSTLFGQQSGDGKDAMMAKRRELIRKSLQQQNQFLQSQAPKHQHYKLEQFMGAIEQLGKASKSCNTTMLPTLPQDLDTSRNNPLHFAKVGQLHLSLAVQALACDLTRVVTMQWGHETYEQPPRWLDAQWSEPLHGVLSHQRTYDAIRKYVAVETFYAEQFASLLDQLQQQGDPLDPGRTLLDNTLVMWTRALGDSEMHTQYSVHYCLAGATDRLATSAQGKHVHFGGLEQINGNASDISQPWQTGMEEPKYKPGDFGPGRPVGGEGWKARSGRPHLQLFQTASQILQLELNNFGQPSSYPASMGDATAVAKELLP